MKGISHPSPPSNNARVTEGWQCRETARRPGSPCGPGADWPWEPGRLPELTDVTACSSLPPGDWAHPAHKAQSLGHLRERDGSTVPCTETCRAYRGRLLTVTQGLTALTGGQACGRQWVMSVGLAGPSPPPVMSERPPTHAASADAGGRTPTTS